jgi:hypothetical protein
VCITVTHTDCITLTPSQIPEVVRKAVEACHEHSRPSSTQRELTQRLVSRPALGLSRVRKEHDVSGLVGWVMM